MNRRAIVGSAAMNGPRSGFVPGCTWKLGPISRPAIAWRMRPGSTASAKTMRKSGPASCFTKALASSQALVIDNFMLPSWLLPLMLNGDERRNRPRLVNTADDR